MRIGNTLVDTDGSGGDMAGYVTGFSESTEDDLRTYQTMVRVM